LKPRSWGDAWQALDERPIGKLLTEFTYYDISYAVDVGKYVVNPNLICAVIQDVYSMSRMFCELEVCKPKRITLSVDKPDMKITDHTDRFLQALPLKQYYWSKLFSGKQMKEAECRKLLTLWLAVDQDLCTRGHYIERFLDIK